jgi:DNA-binding NtrC family response regulator
MAGGAETVLVVDDEASIRLLCRVNLELEGYRVLEAESVDDARAILSAEPVAVALLDVHIGLDDGLALLAEIRTTHPEIGVALLTGTAQIDPVEREGADALIPKPFELEQLVTTVRELALKPSGIDSSRWSIGNPRTPG